MTPSALVFSVCMVPLSRMPLLIAVIVVFLVVVLATLHRSSTLIARRLLRRLLAAVVVLGAIAEATVLFSLRGPERRPYLAVLPFAPGGASSQAWALSRSLSDNARNLCGNYYVSSFPSVLEAVDVDSCARQDYVARFAQRSGLDACLSGEVVAEGEEIGLRARLYHKGAWADTIFSCSEDDLQSLVAAAQEWLARTLSCRRARVATAVSWDTSLARADLFLHQKAYERARRVLAGTHTSLAQLLVARSYLEEAKGLRALGRPWRETLYYAVTATEQLVQQDSSCASAFLLGAECAVLQEEWDQAEIYLRKVLTLDATSSHALVLMTRLHRSRFRDLGFEDEEQLLRRAIWYDPLNISARLGLVEYLKEMARRREALEAVEEVLRVNPTSAPGQVVKGKLLIAWEQNEEGFACLERALRLAPDDPEVLFALGVAHYVANHDELARGFFERAIAVGDHLDSYLYLGLIARRSGKPEEALPYLQERVLRKRDPQDRMAEIAREHIFQITH